MSKLFSIQTGDAISIYNQDFIVKEVFKLGTGRAQNFNCRLEDGAAQKWLCVRNYDQPLPVLCALTSLDTWDQSDTVTVGAITYQLLRKGRTRAIAPSEQGYNKFTHIEYYDYQSDLNYLFVQRDDHNTIILAGEALAESAVTVYGSPGK